LLLRVYVSTQDVEPAGGCAGRPGEVGGVNSRCRVQAFGSRKLKVESWAETERGQCWTGPRSNYIKTTSFSTFINPGKVAPFAHSFSLRTTRLGVSNGQVLGRRPAPTSRPVAESSRLWHPTIAQIDIFTTSCGQSQCPISRLWRGKASTPTSS